MIFVILFDMLLLVFIQAILSFVLSRKTINISNDIARKYGNFTVKDFRRYETWEIVKRIFYFFSELGLSKGASIKTCFIGTGAALENLPYDLSDYLSVLEHLVKYLIIGASFYWNVARILRDIVIIILYIFGQLFFMPCGVTCQAWSEVPINDGRWQFRYSLYNVCIEVYREIFCGSYGFLRYFL